MLSNSSLTEDLLHLICSGSLLNSQYLIQLTVVYLLLGTSPTSKWKATWEVITIIACNNKLVCRVYLPKGLPPPKNINLNNN